MRDNCDRFAAYTHGNTAQQSPILQYDFNWIYFNFSTIPSIICIQWSLCCPKMYSLMQFSRHIKVTMRFVFIMVYFWALSITLAEDSSSSEQCDTIYPVEMIDIGWRTVQMVHLHLILYIL